MPATDTPAATPTSLDVALSYARRGWRVVPVPSGAKFPSGLKAWQTEGSTDEAKIRHWWTNAPDDGIGIVCGATSGLWVLDVDVAGDKVGDETLAELEDAYGPLPATYEVITGSGGRHLYFAWPTDGQVVTNSASGRLGPGLDVRGEGGFVVAPPSMHANGQRYEVEASAPDHLAPAPPWLLGLLADPEPVTTPRQRHPAVGDRPGDVFAATVEWSDLLGADGWTLHHVDNDGEQHWTRPGKERRDGTSATTGYKGSDVLKVFTSSMPLLRTDETYTKLGYWAATRHGGDFGAAASDLRAQGHHAPPTTTQTAPAVGDATTGDEAVAESERADWAPIDLSTILNGDHHAPLPTICAPAGAPPLFYAGRTNAIFGESGAGKTWVALAAIVEVLNGGGTAILIDLEDTPHGIVSRLTALGVTPATITHQFIYVAPQTGWGPVAQASVAALVDERAPELVVLDSTGEAMAAGGVKGNDDDDVARWFVTFPKFIARRGPAVIIIDHVPKDPNAPTKYMIGSQRKTAAIDGASYRVDAITAPSKVTDGVLKVIVAKDRHGTRSQGDTASMVHLTHDLIGGFKLTMLPPENLTTDRDGKPRLTIYMERISRWLEENPGESKKQIEEGVTGKVSLIRSAFGTLLTEGHIDRESGAKTHAWVVVKPYREEDDPMLSHATTDDRAKGVVPHGPTSSLHIGDDPPGVGSSPRPLPRRGRGSIHGSPRTRKIGVTRPPLVPFFAGGGRPRGRIHLCRPPPTQRRPGMKCVWCRCQIDRDLLRIEKGAAPIHGHPITADRDYCSVACLAADIDNMKDHAE